MSGDKYPKFRAAAVQAAPVFLNREATIDKVETLLTEATANGAKLVVFPESFIPCFQMCIRDRIWVPFDFSNQHKPNIHAAFKT